MAPAHILIIFLALGGFSLAFYIYYQKNRGEKLVCPLGFDCDVVVKSEHSTFFGIPLEALGMVYYLLIASSYVFFIFFPSQIGEGFVFFLLLATACAFLFSLYLTFIQAFALKEWCSWCLVSTGITILIFFLAVLGSNLDFIRLLGERHDLILIIHAIGAAVGLGGATAADFLFFKFLKDFRISKKEADVLHSLSQVIWFALVLIVISGLGLYLIHPAELNQSPKFLVKMMVVLVLILNGVFLNILIAPRLVKISFHERHDHERGELERTRRLAFALGAVSVTSWYSAFILGMMREVDLGFLELAGAYAAVLLLAVLASQLVEKSFSK